jgi:hypothetical protein
MMLRAITNPRTFLRIALADFAEVDLRENFESVVGILGRVLPDSTSPHLFCHGLAISNGRNLAKKHGGS